MEADLSLLSTFCSYVQLLEWSSGSWKLNTNAYQLFEKTQIKVTMILDRLQIFRLSFSFNSAIYKLSNKKDKEVKIALFVLISF